MQNKWSWQGLGFVASVTLSSVVGCQSVVPTSEETMAAPSEAAMFETVPMVYRDFGEPMQGDPQDAVAADVVLASVSQYDGQQLRVRGQVQEVCQKRGCWLTLAGQERQEPIFVKFTCPIDGRLIPREAVGREVIVEGELQQTQISEAMARHFAEDAGASEEEIAAIQGPQPWLRIASPSARVLNLPEAEASQQQ